MNNDVSGAGLWRMGRRPSQGGEHYEGGRSVMLGATEESDSAIPQEMRTPLKRAVLYTHSLEVHTIYCVW